MNEVINNILTRRSIRDFTEQSLTKAEILPLLEVARYAPSGMNLQTAKYTAVLNKEIIKELADAIGAVLSRENYRFYGATALIITSNERDSKWNREDNACAMQNIMLAAHSVGIGSVWINQLLTICDEPIIRNILNKLEIPENHVVYGVAALGYSACEPKGQIAKKNNCHIVE